MYSEGFNLRQTLVLETDPEIAPQAGEGTADIMKYTPNEVVIKTFSTVPKILFLSDVYDPGWRGAVDGKETDPRADYDFRAVAVPQVRTLRMVYWPSFVYGLWMARIGVGLTVITFASKIMKIGFYSPYLDTLGGGERYTLTLASCWSKFMTFQFFGTIKRSCRCAETLKFGSFEDKSYSGYFRGRNVFKKLLLTRQYDLILYSDSIPSTLAKPISSITKSRFRPLSTLQ
jgi:hypothetical protein